MELIDGFSKHEVIASFSSKVLELIILPTEQCNLRCVYCYEDFEIGKMSQDTVQGIKNLLSQRIPTLKQLTISWFGGEPLLAKNIILDISSFAYELCKKHKVNFYGGFTTNAYSLTPELMQQFSDLNQTGYQITLDGDRTEHDKTRISRKGYATFDIIWANLIAARDSDNKNFSITLRIHHTKHNFDSVKSLVTKVKSEFGEDPRFQIHFHKISDLGGPNKVDALGYDEYKERLKLLDEMLNKELPYNHEYQVNPSSNYICYASKPNSLLIRANGRIGKCTVALANPKNDIGKILPSGLLEINNKKLRPWMHGFEDMDVDKLGCPVSKLPDYEVGEEIEIQNVG